MSAAGCHDNRMDKIWWNEQWMGWPLGPQYAASSNVDNASKLQGELLLVVGELDTNVDPSSTMQVVNALIKANKNFDLLVIPGADHTRRRRRTAIASATTSSCTTCSASSRRSETPRKRFRPDAPADNHDSPLSIPHNGQTVFRFSLGHHARRHRRGANRSVRRAIPRGRHASAKARLDHRRRAAGAHREGAAADGGATASAPSLLEGGHEHGLLHRTSAGASASGRSCVVIPAKGELGVGVARRSRRARARELIKFANDVRVWQEDESPYQVVAGILKDRGVSHGQGRRRGARALLHRRRRATGPRRPSSSSIATPVTAGCRMIKSPAEIALMQHANDITIAAYQGGVRDAARGHDAGRAVGDNIARRLPRSSAASGGGALVSFGKYTAFPHGSIAAADAEAKATSC